MNPRSLVVSKLNGIIGNERKAQNIEISIFNWSLMNIDKKNMEFNHHFKYMPTKLLENFEKKGFPKKMENSWDNRWFKKQYMNKARSILFNLKDSKNPSFKERVMDGSIKSKDVAFMSNYDINPAVWNSDAEKKSKNIGQTLKILYLNGYTIKGTSSGEEKKSTGMYQCEKCSSRNIDIFQLQTRSADEPMTIFFTCKDCNFRWKDDGKD